MADIRLISILPPQQPVKGATVPQGTSGSNSVPSLAGIENGTTLSGFIINRDTGGNPILRTESGDITFASNFFLKIGSEVVIRVETGPQQSLARILSVDGKSPEVAETTSAFSTQPEVLITPQYRPPSALVSLNASVPANLAPTGNPNAITVFGTLIKPPALTPGTAQPPALPSGTQVALRVVSVEAPATPPSTTPAPTAPAYPGSSSANYAAYARAQGAAPPPPTTPATAANTAAAAPTAPVPAAAITVSTTAIPTATAQPTIPTVPLPTQPLTAAAPPPAAIPAPSAPAEPLQTYTGQIVTAQVLGHEATGEALLQTPIGVVRLQPETMLPTGSTITAQILQTTPPALSALNFTLSPGQPVSSRPAPLLELAQQWSSLQQIFTLLTGHLSGLGAAPQLAPLPGVTTTPPPATPPNFTPKDIGSGLMLFISALRGGDFRGWLGKDNLKWLEDQGQGNLVKKAEGEFNTLATQYTEAKPNSWQALFFPIAVDGMVQQVRMYTKRDRKGGGQQGETAKSDETRFVIEMDLTQLGELQMDGFVRKQEQNVSFDLMIRSLHPLDKEIQQDILSIYNATGAITGYKGSLTFQAVREFPVNPMQDLVASMNAFTV